MFTAPHPDVCLGGGGKNRGSGRGRGGRGGGRGGRGGRGGKKSGRRHQPDWTCGACGAMVFGSKSACFKCGVAKGLGRGGSTRASSSTSKSSSAATSVGTVDIDHDSRALIRALMSPADTQKGPAPNDQNVPLVHSSHCSSQLKRNYPPGLGQCPGLQSSAPPSAQPPEWSLSEQLAKMGFSVTDIQQAGKAHMLSNLSTALDWLLIHTPEGRIPPTLKNASVSSSACVERGKGQGGRSQIDIKKQVQAVTPAQKVISILTSFGFDKMTARACVSQSRAKSLMTESLKVELGNLWISTCISSFLSSSFFFFVLVAS